MEEQDSPPGFWARLGRGVWRVVRFVLLLVILSALGVILVFGGQQIVGEVNRSFENINRRFDIQSQQIEGVQSDVGGLLQTDAAAAEALRALGQDMTRQASRLEEQAEVVEALRRALSADLTEQADWLATLTARAVENAQTAAELGGAIAAAQGDVNENARRLDDLSRELAQSQTATTSELATLRAEYATPEEEVVAVMTSLAYFRVWELIARARLRLVENNVGLAQADVALALSMAADLSAIDTAAATGLPAVQQRLALAAANLPADPIAAARDLEAAWEQLDRLLGLLLIPASPATPTPATADATLTPPPATPTSLPATPVPTTTVTPLPTATP